jgi:hypothetical protein
MIPITSCARTLGSSKEIYKRGAVARTMLTECYSTWLDRRSQKLATDIIGGWVSGHNPRPSRISTPGTCPAFPCGMPNASIRLYVLLPGTIVFGASAKRPRRRGHSLHRLFGFEENQGQYPKGILYGFRPGAYLTASALLLAAGQVSIQFAGADPNAAMRPGGRSTTCW